MQKHTHTALKNASFNLIGYIYPMLIAFIVAPITVKFLGIRDYGLYIFISTLLSLVGLLDLGISTAVSRFLSKYHAVNSQKNMDDLIGSANSVFTIMGIVGFLVFFTIALIGHFFIPPHIIDYPYYSFAFIFAGLLFFVSSLNSIFAIIPNALGRFDLSNKIGLFVITLQQISIVVVLFFNYSIMSIFVIQFLIAIISGFLHRHISKKLIPTLSFSFKWNKQEILNFYKFGLTSFANNLAGSSLTYLDRLIIPFLLGPSNLTYYTLPGNITSKTPGIANTLSGTLFPLTTQLDSLGDTEKIKTLYIRSTRLILVVSTAITITMISFSYEILQYWINIDVADKGYKVLIILALTNLILAILSPLSNLLLGLGRLRSLTITSVIIALSNAMLLFLLIPHFGLEGAAWAYFLSLFPIIWLIYEVERKHLKLGSKRIKYHISSIIKLSVVCVFTYIINVFLLKILIINLLTLIIILPLSISIYLLIFKLLGFFEKEDTDDIMTFINKSFRVFNKNEQK